MRSRALVALLVLALAACHGGPGNQAKDTAADAPQVPLATAAVATYTMHVRAQGRVGAPAGSEAKLSFAGSGIVARIDVHVGEAVRAGDALAELDTSGLALDLAQARADASAQPRLIAAQSRLSALERGDGSAQSDREAADAAVRQSEERLVADQRALDRTQALFTGGVAAQKDLDAARQQLELDRADLSANRARAATARAGITGAITQARADVAQAAADVQAARIRLAMAQRNVAIATLRAPASGVVSQILKHPGEAVDPTQPAIVVGPPTTHIVTLTVAGDDAARVAVGAAVDVQVVGRGLRGHGIVRSVVASVDPATQASTVLVDGVPDGAAPGEAVEATIDAGERRGIVIPTAAIVEDPQSGTSVVFVREKTKDGEKFVSRTIGVAAGDEAKTLVTGGLKVGEQIAAQGAFDLLAPAGGG